MAPGLFRLGAIKCINKFENGMAYGPCRFVKQFVVQQRSPAVGAATKPKTRARQALFWFGAAAGKKEKRTSYDSLDMDRLEQN